jgi:uncharacterized damage-inducible protein DinB
MSIIEILKKELAYEVSALRKMLERVPFEKADWKPHEKSMSMLSLSTHLAEIPGWIGMMLHTTELDFAKSPYVPAKVSSTADLLNLMEKSYKESVVAMENMSEEDLSKRWALKNDGHVLADMSKYESMRHSLNQITHHRAQLGVYLRLLNIPIPGTYGPSADEMKF